MKHDDRAFLENTTFSLSDLHRTLDEQFASEEWEENFDRYLSAHVCLRLIKEYAGRVHGAVSAPVVVRMGIVASEKISDFEQLCPNPRQLIMESLIMPAALTKLEGDLQNLTICGSQRNQWEKIRTRFLRCLSEIQEEEV